jgi:hypothetical protein
VGEPWTVAELEQGVIAFMQLQRKLEAEAATRSEACSRKGYRFVAAPWRRG